MIEINASGQVSSKTRKQATAAIAATNILAEFEDVIIPGAQSYYNQWQSNKKNMLLDMVDDDEDEIQALIYGEEVNETNDDPVSVRQQLVSELSFIRKRDSTKSKDLNLKAETLKITLQSSQPEVEMFERVSDIMMKNCRRNLPVSPSKEIILEETKTQPIYSYMKIRPSLTKKVRMPISGSKLRTEVKQVKKSDLRVNSDGTFMEV